MKTLTIEDDLYRRIMNDVARTGKSPTDVVKGYRNDAHRENGRETTQGEMASFLSSSQFQAHRTAVKKYLAVLSLAYQENPDKFSGLERSVSGRSRKYFSTDKSELEKSGTHVNPQQIPESPYWAATNNSTARKKSLIEDVLRFLNYDRRVIEQARNAI